jgi:peptide/nickel transport system substrate-binding protein
MSWGTGYPVLNAESLVGADLLGKLDINVDLQSMDWGTMIRRRNNKDTIDKGGWSAFCTGWEGLNHVDPGAHCQIAGTGEKGWFRWFTSPKMEEQRSAWFDATAIAAQKKVAEQIQLDVWEDAPYYPLGQWLQPIAHRTTIEGIVKSPFPLFLNVKKAIQPECCPD